jgi:hypothetical protein
MTPKANTPQGYLTHLPNTPFSPPAPPGFSLLILLASKLILDAMNRLPRLGSASAACSFLSDWLIAAALTAALPNGRGEDIRGGCCCCCAASRSLVTLCDADRPSRPGADSLGFFFSFRFSDGYAALRLAGADVDDGPARFRLDASFFNRPVAFPRSPLAYGEDDDVEGRPNPIGGGDVGTGALAAAVRYVDSELPRTTGAGLPPAVSCWRCPARLVSLLREGIVVTPGERGMERMLGARVTDGV